MMKSLKTLEPKSLKELIRLGDKSDGGYVIPLHCLKITKLLIGLGINNNWSFESEFTKKNNACICVGIDNSVNFFEFISRSCDRILYSFLQLVLLRINSETFRIFKSGFNYLLTAFKFKIYFRGKNKFLNKTMSNKTGDQFLSLGELINQYRPNKESIFLKIDIEGDEYKLLNGLIKFRDSINGFVAEFHHLTICWDYFIGEIKKLEKFYTIVHVHGNNYGDLIPGTKIPESLEITFINKKLINKNEKKNKRISYPIKGLDFPNNPKKADYELQF